MKNHISHLSTSSWIRNELWLHSVHLAWLGASVSFPSILRSLLLSLRLPSFCTFHCRSINYSLSPELVGLLCIPTSDGRYIQHSPLLLCILFKLIAGPSCSNLRFYSCKHRFSRYSRQCIIRTTKQQRVRYVYVARGSPLFDSFDSTIRSWNITIVWALVESITRWLIGVPPQHPPSASCAEVQAFLGQFLLVLYYHLTPHEAQQQAMKIKADGQRLYELPEKGVERSIWISRRKNSSCTADKQIWLCKLIFQIYITRRFY